MDRKKRGAIWFTSEKPFTTWHDLLLKEAFLIGSSGAKEGGAGDVQRKAFLD